MSKLRARWLALTAAVTAIASWLVNLWGTRQGWPTLVLPYESIITLVAVGGFTLYMGWRVKRLRDGKDTKLSPLVAVRILVLGQALAYTGALIVGWHAGLMVDQLATWNERANHGNTWNALALIGTGLALVAVGYIVESFCKIPPQDTDGVERGTEDHGEYA